MQFKNAGACVSVACKVMVFCLPLVTDEFHQASDTAAGVHVVPDEVPWDGGWYQASKFVPLPACLWHSSIRLSYLVALFIQKWLYVVGGMLKSKNNWLAVWLHLEALLPVRILSLSLSVCLSVLVSVSVCLFPPTPPPPSMAWGSLVVTCLCAFNSSFTLKTCQEKFEGEKSPCFQYPFSLVGHAPGHWKRDCPRWFIYFTSKKKGKKKVTDEVAGEEKVLNGGVFQLSSGWVVLMVLLSLSLFVCALRIW